MEKVKFRLADRSNFSDDENIRELINSTTMQSDIELVYTKEPSFLEATNIKGYEVQTVVGEKDRRICVVGSRSLSNNYINGKVETLGYLSDLKIAPKTGKRTLSEGYLYIKSLMADGRAKTHITTIIEDNKNAKAALTWQNKSKALPNYYNLGLINNYFIFPTLKKHYQKTVEILRGEKNRLKNIVEFLNAEGKKKQFFPSFTEEYFLTLKDFDIKDFYIAYRSGEIVGVLAKWNQNEFKQIVLKSYNNKMKWLKYLPFLPKEKQKLNFVYASFFAVKNNDSDIFNQLFAYFYNDNFKNGFIALSMHEKDSLNKVAKQYLKINYKSRLYVSEYKTDEEIHAMLDDRVPYIEVGVL